VYHFWFGFNDLARFQRRKTMKDKKNTTIEVVYEDDYLLAVNKPSGVVVNRSHTHLDHTVQDWVEENYNLLSKYSNQGNLEFIQRSGIAHRIDKDTSGVLVIAKNPDVLLDLMSQFKQRKIEKQYVAIVHGVLTEPVVEVNAPLGRNPKNFMKFAVVASGKHAFTRVEKVKDLVIGEKKYTLVDIFPKTGRTHQIRVHMSALGNYIAGDKLYCASNLLKVDEEVFGRMMLHAKKISFLHPYTHNIIEIEAKSPVEFNV
jgi:23S rRNA pseudouridine1911/1915/1917 synthase